MKPPGSMTIECRICGDPQKVRVVLNVSQPKHVGGSLEFPLWMEADPDDVEAYGVHVRGHDGETRHMCPPKGSGLMPCCGRSPTDVPLTHRLTASGDFVTCGRT